MDQTNVSNIDGLTNKVSHYAIGKTIGEGTFGKVKLGIDLITKQNVAIKMLIKTRITDKSDRERVAREIKILKMVYHPNIIQLYEIIENNEAIYLIMEYASNGELFEHIVKSNKLTEKESAIIFSQILSAIEYLGNLGIVHRDLKPENMLFDYQGKVKIVDFGLGTTYLGDQMLKTSCGSPCYASPEMVLGKPYKPLQTDMWSSGVILFAMLTGTLPFEDKNINSLFRKIINCEYTMPSYLSEDAKQMIRGLLVTCPDKRIAIKQLKKMKFITSNAAEIAHNKDTQKVDATIVEKLSTYFDNNYIYDSIRQHKHNTISTMYYILLNIAQSNEPVEIDISTLQSTSFYDDKEDRSYICLQRPLSKHIRDLSAKRNCTSSLDLNNYKLNRTATAQYECSAFNEPQQSNEDSSNFRAVRHTSAGKTRITPLSPQRGFGSKISVLPESTMAIIKEEGNNPVKHIVIAKMDKALPKANIVFHSLQDPMKSKRNSMRLNHNNALCNRTSSEITPKKERQMGVIQTSPPNNQSHNYETECSTARVKNSMQKYDGPINLSLAFSKKPEDVVSKIKRLFTQFKITMTWAHTFSCLCLKGNLKFELEIMEVEYMTNVYYCRLLFLASPDSETVRLIQDRVLGTVLT